MIGAVAQGDLSKSMALEADGRPLEGEFLRTAMIINKMVQQLGAFSAEVTRVAREVGSPQPCESGRAAATMAHSPERWMSGLSRTPGKRVRVNSPPRVRIPPSPPEKS